MVTSKRAYAYRQSVASNPAKNFCDFNCYACQIVSDISLTSLPNNFLAKNFHDFESA